MSASKQLAQVHFMANEGKEKKKKKALLGKVHLILK